MSQRPSEPPSLEADRERCQQDLDLVQRALLRQPEALGGLVERLQCVPRILLYKNRQLGAPLSGHELEDLAQETLLAIWKKLDRFEGRSRLETWVYRFCFLELMARLRHLNRQPTFVSDVEPLTDGRSARPPDPFRFETIYRGLEKLDAGSASILKMKHFEGLTFDQIAERLGVSSNTVKTRYYRALPKLRALLQTPAGSRSEEKSS
ncbi:MAG: sigma-70 family RNA polymerase sigma factor [Planctomycetota bacterium]